MTKQEFLAMSLPHGLKCVITWDSKQTVEALSGLTSTGDDCQCDNYDGGIEGIYPILIHTSMLTDEIPHNGKTFVPIVELGKIAFPFANHSKYRLINGDHGYGVYFENYSNKREFTFQYFKDNSIQAYSIESNGRNAKYTSIHNITELISKLIEWHFDIAGLIEKGEAIPVTKEFNPYK